MFEPIFQRTQNERDDTVKTVKNNKSDEQKARVKALSERVQGDYFDSGLHQEEISKVQGGSIK